MVQYEEATLDRSLAALADPTRRAILDRLSRGNASVSELAEPFEMSLTGLKKHVGILEGAELVTTEKVGRTRVCRLGPQTLEDVQTWVTAHQRALVDRMDRLGDLVDEMEGGHGHGR